MQDMYHLENVARANAFADIAQKNDVVAEGHAAVFRAQLRPRAADRYGQAGKALTVGHDLVDEPLSDDPTLAFALDVGSDLGEIALRAAENDEARHLRVFWRLAKAIEMLADMSPHVIGGVASAFRDRCIQPLT